ncbi:unnamed protein product [Acanthosepion pharaonis]|uniref:Anoctamin n=1 Tax=Acanthosepion pharaonis TaxID=158019 RepID=A0A812E7Q1_ACAPH|nr:unnamed protein product [Sepia pharaonis]
MPVLHISDYNVMNENSSYNSSVSAIDSLKRTVSDVLSVIQESFDNDITPYFALIICLWGTIFMEVWKRKSAELAHQWDVVNYEALEPNRPEFHGSKQYEVCLVATSVMGVIVYRVIISIDYCASLTEMHCFMLTTIVSSILNAISILLLGIAYTHLAYKLTSWENHRTQSSFDDALIIKLFAFHFANSYASCFYIAFLRGRTLHEGILGMGTSYQDECDGSCMSQLSFQVLVLMITKPFPKLLKDVIVPKISKLWRIAMRTRYFGSKVEQETEETSSNIQSKKLWMESHIQEELNKPKLKDFTLEEYTEKMIQYGYLMVHGRENVHNAFLIAFTSRWSEKFTLVKRLWIVIGFEHIVFAVKLFIEFFIPDSPAYVKLSIRQNKFKIAERLKKETKDYRNIVPEDAPVTCGISLSGGGKQHRVKRKSMHSVEMPTKQKKGSVADDEDEDGGGGGGGDSDGACAIFRDRLVNRNRPHSLAAAGSTSLSLGNHPESKL